MPASSAIIAASKDADLRDRAVALAAELGIKNPELFVDEHRPALAAAAVDDSGENSVASVYEYADTVYQGKLVELTPPGKNPSAVTDDHLRHALKLVYDRENPVTEVTSPQES